MENGRNTNLRSLVRPVSPLSRWQKPPLPVDNEVDEVDSEVRGLIRKRLNRSRSRSPALFSSVHLASTGLSAGGVDIQPSEETRRIIVRRPLQDPIDDEPRDHKEKQSKSRPDDYSRLSNNKRRTRDEHTRKPIPRSILFKNRSIPAPSGIDRENTCPILLRLFYSTNARHYSLSDYSKGRTPENEIQFSTWIDASLAELAEEVRNVVPVARRRGTRMHFAIVYPDSRGTYGRRQLGVVITGYGSNSGEIDDTPTETTNIRNNSTIQRPFNLLDDSAITLLSKKFQIGDYVDCAIVEYTPGSLVGWSSGRRPLGPPPPTGPDSRSSLREEARMI
ncbi:Histone deacetylase complex subunit SAP18 [Schistosoma japonicum]|nr:Histone deacetylase complex subunit SAP18 [Schistosoma japonicum]KAH8858851.1 Histone deacetylase complex subunit SAP18 [Schistosoma japonicum]